MANFTANFRLSVVHILPKIIPQAVPLSELGRVPSLVGPSDNHLLT